MSTELLLSALVSLLIATGGVAGTMYATRSARSQAAVAQSSNDRNAGYDQVQEDLKEVRAELERVDTRAKVREQRDDRKLRNQDQVIRHLDDEINELRKLMIDSGLTPPPRKPWPPYPGEWVEAPV